GKLKEAEESAVEACALLDAPQHQDSRALALSNLAVIRDKRGDVAGALKSYAEAEAVLRGLLKQKPDAPSHDLWGMLVSNSESVKLRTKGPDEPYLLGSLATLQSNRATMHFESGNLADARKGLEAARDSLLALTVRFPDDGRFQYDLAMTHLNLGTTLAQ